METLTALDVTQLINAEEEHCVSLYLPTRPLISARQQNQIHLKNLLNTAEEMLVAQGCRSTDAQDLLAPARKLLHDSIFWEQAGATLALFLGSESWRQFWLPTDVEQGVYVGNRFRIRPLLSVTDGGRYFYLLTLSHNDVRLFRATSFSIDQLKVDGLPSSAAEALNYDSPQRVTQYHSSMRGRLGKEAAVFHGQGGQPDARKAEGEQFYRLVADAVHENLKNQKAPLVLATVEANVPLYRKVNRYAHLFDQAVTGSPDRLSAEELYRLALPIMDPFFEKTRRSAIARAERLLGTGEASNDIRVIVPAATQGRVETLLLDPNIAMWGRYDPSADVPDVYESKQAGDEDLAELAAVETLRHGGDVIAIVDKMSRCRPVSAIFRF